MSSLSSEKEIVKFFALSSINVRPEACALIVEHLRHLSYTDDKRLMLNKFVKYYKEWQSLNQKSNQMMAKTQSYSLADNTVLDVETAGKIFASLSLNSSKDNHEAPAAQAKKSFASFKNLKKEK